MDTRDESHSKRNDIHNSPSSFLKNISTRFNINLFTFIMIVLTFVMYSYRKPIKKEIRKHLC
jgi:hypothetical protein